MHTYISILVVILELDYAQRDKQHKMAFHQHFVARGHLPDVSCRLCHVTMLLLHVYDTTHDPSLPAHIEVK